MVPIVDGADVGQTQPRWTVGDRLWEVNPFTKTDSGDAHDRVVEVVAEPTQFFMITAPTARGTGEWTYMIRRTPPRSKAYNTWTGEDQLSVEPPKPNDPRRRNPT